ncbi:unnamed protein product, partial [Prorocentrum cordatum]
GSADWNFRGICDGDPVAEFRGACHRARSQGKGPCRGAQESMLSSRHRLLGEADQGPV